MTAARPSDFDPESGFADAYDDRPEFIVRVPDPIRAKRGARARKKGVHTELECRRIFEAAGFEVLGQGGPGRRDFHASKSGLRFSVEVKHKSGSWPTNSQSAKDWQQAVNQAQADMIPLLVQCNRQGSGKKVLWRCWAPSGAEDLIDWLARI